MLEFDKVSKYFWVGNACNVILHDASFSFDTGQSLGILAPNGSGKTTIINMIAGIEKPDSGRIRCDCRISFPLDSVRDIDPRLSGSQHARYIARLYQRDPLEVEAFCSWMSDIGEFYDLPVGIYSEGMIARFVISLMLALDFDLYLVDEGLPMTLDSRFNRICEDLFQEKLNRSSVIMVSHQIETLQRYCTSAAVLAGGKLHFFQTLSEARYVYAQVAKA